MRIPGTLGGVLLAVMLSSCDDGDVIIDDFGTAGYATVAGSIPDVAGNPAIGAVFVSCGLDEPDWFGQIVDLPEPGTYRVELEWPMLEDREILAARDWQGVCHIGYPSNRPPYSEATDTVLFAPKKDRAVVTTIDLEPVGS